MECYAKNVDSGGWGTNISKVELKIDDEKLVWNTAPVEQYLKTITKGIPCAGIVVLEMTATDVTGRRYIVTESLNIPPLMTHLSYSIQDASGESGDYCILTIEQQAVDLTTSDSPIKSVVLKANGKVWADTGEISVHNYQPSPLSRQVASGTIYRLELIATDADGNTHTYLQNVECGAEGQTSPESWWKPSVFMETPDCSPKGEKSQIKITLAATDPSNGDARITEVVILVDGKRFWSSGTVGVVNYPDGGGTTTVTGEVDYGNHTIEVRATNIHGQTSSVTHNVICGD